MKEYDIMEKLREDAKDIDIPEELKPEAIKEMLRDRQAATGKTAHIHPIRRYMGRVAAAAAIVLCIGGMYAAVRQGGTNDDMILADRDQESDGAQADGMSSGDREDDKEENKTLGTMFASAGSYEAVYDELSRTMEEMNVDTADMADRDTAAPETDGASDSASDTSGQQKFEESASDEGYSKTNLMTEGVDESDIVKTDGSYIYMVTGDSVTITDIRSGQPKEIAAVKPDTQRTAEILELYVEADRLIVITQEAGSSLQEADMEEGDICTDVYYMDYENVACAYVYDISDPSKPELTGSTTQDGRYQTSRKMGDDLYLFTWNDMHLPDTSKEEAVMEKNTSSWIPSVDGEAVDADCIYLPERGQRGLLIASVDVTKPQKTTDSKLILMDYAQIYVSSSAVYLYENMYDENLNGTQLSKFLLQNGSIQPVNAASVKGEITDSFAINEYQGYLRILTTDFSSGDRDNGVYVLDSNLRPVGSISGIAPGEEIYSARFLQNTGYFVTYRNTDPLFSVDFSDPKNPKLLGELKVTGFSEYLHFWGEDKLLGIGYETDPDTGEQYGIKLSMFDISDPSNVTEESRYVIEGAEYSNALYDYKAVLADPGKNLIGFAYIDYNNEKSRYAVFSYTKEGGFVLKTQMKLKKYLEEVEKYRGLYAGDYFYLAGNGHIRAYDMTKEFQRIDE